MIRKNHENVLYFVGTEVEHTPAFSKKTLFVVGYQPVKEILQLAQENKVQHIYLGANRSFKIDYDWDDLVTQLLNLSYWVTLDYPVDSHSQLTTSLSRGVWQSRLFVPLASVDIPNIDHSNPNFTVKIDDKQAHNDGVWCLNYRHLMDSNRFTAWHEYENDVVIKTKAVETVKLFDDSVIQIPAIVEIKEEPVEVNDAVVIDTEPVERMRITNEGTFLGPVSVEVDEVAEMYAGTNSSSIDNNEEVDKEPELVAKKTVKQAKFKSSKSRNV